MSGIEITPTDTHAAVEAGEAFLLDCREQDEWDHVHIEGATLIPMSELNARVGELPAPGERPVIVYCHHGMRSLRVATALRSAGYADAQSMAGGIDAWAAEVEPGMARY